MRKIATCFVTLLCQHKVSSFMYPSSPTSLTCRKSLEMKNIINTRRVNTFKYQMTENDGSNDPIIVDTGASSSDTSTEKTTVPSSNKEKVWNTSIFPTKVAMSPPVEKDKITPQLFIQTIAALIGITSGLAVAVFKLSIEAVRQFFYNSSIVSSGVLPIYYIPIIGSVGVALLSLTGDFSPGLRGVVKEVDDDSLNVQFENAIKGKKNSFGWLNNTGRAIRKSLAAILTLGTGNSLGPEGPSVEIATAMSRLGMLLWPANWFSNKDSITDYAEGGCGRISRNRLLVACGAAAGVSSGFNAPLSGVFFALEVVQASLQPVNVPSPIETDNDTAGINDVSTDSGLELQQQSLTSIQGSISAILLSSVLAALVARGVLGNELALGLVNYEIRTPLIELPLYILLGVSCGSISVVFTETAKFFKSLFDGNVGPKAVKKTFNAIPAPALPIVGGLTCGIVGYFYPQILFFGYDTLNKLLGDNKMPLGLLLSLLGAKTLTTAVCAACGLVGGTLAPSLFLGGMVGASFHSIVDLFFTTLNIPETITSSTGLIFDLAGVPAYSMIGAASVLAAIFRAPLTASLLLFEITRNYDVLLPLLASAGVASLFSDIVGSKINEPKLNKK